MSTLTTRNGYIKPGESDRRIQTILSDIPTTFDLLDVCTATSNWAGVAAPTANDDVTQGYSAGSVWYYSTKMYRCYSALVGAAVWVQIWPPLAADLSGNVAAHTLNGHADTYFAAESELAAYLNKNGTVGLTADWAVGAYKITAAQLAANIAIGTAPLVITSTTKVSNLNVDQVDGVDIPAIAAKGDVLTGSGASALAKTAVGANGSNLIADSSQSGGINWSTGGWSPGPALTFSSADAPTYVVTYTGDWTGAIPVGARMKMTEAAAVKYFIVTAHVAGTITLYGGTDYTLAATITLPYYSREKAPVGFPLDPAKWSQVLEDITDHSQSTPTTGTWYNAGSLNIAIPIGGWWVQYRGSIACSTDSSHTVADIWITLSTANNSESDAEFSSMFYFVSSATSLHPMFATFCRKSVILAAKTAYYANIRTTQTNVSSIELRNDFAMFRVCATCAYL